MNQFKNLIIKKILKKYLEKKINNLQNLRNETCQAIHSQ